ncbi:MAG: hypothetical protein ACK2U1_19410 [Anaerolineales bacterium]|jgi:hypothetical protein
MLLRNISSWLFKISNGWVALTGLTIFVLFSVLILPAQSSQADEISGETGSPDMSFFYSSQNLFNMAEAYGEQGRTDYIRARFTFDLVWPLVYGFFLSSSISWLIKRAELSEKPLGLLNLVPVLGVLFDYFENITTSWVMFRYPQHAMFPAMLAPFLTATKWIFVGGSFVILIFVIFIFIWKTIRSRKRSPNQIIG